MNGIHIKEVIRWLTKSIHNLRNINTSAFIDLLPIELNQAMQRLLFASIVLLLSGVGFSTPPDASQGIPAVKTWALNQVSIGEKEFDASGIERTPSPSHWETKVVYQIMVDRFNNGNLTNDNLNVPSEQREQ